MHTQFMGLRPIVISRYFTSLSSSPFLRENVICDALRRRQRRIDGLEMRSRSARKRRKKTRKRKKENGSFIFRRNWREIVPTTTVIPANPATLHTHTRGIYMYIVPETCSLISHRYHQHDPPNRGTRSVHHPIVSH